MAIPRTHSRWWDMASKRKAAVDAVDDLDGVESAGELPEGALPEGAHEVVTPEIEPVVDEPEPEPAAPEVPAAGRKPPRGGKERWPLGRWGYRK